MRRHLACTLACIFALAAAPAHAAGAGSLYTGGGHRPGPDVLYAPAAQAPQLTNAGIWKAPPILVSGAEAYRDGEFLYQDFLYDDHGANAAQDPSDPRSGSNTFSRPDGTYTYPTDRRYANNAADLVELRVRPTTDATAFRVTLNTLNDPSLVAFSIAIGGTPGQPHPFPLGANVSAPADLFLTVHPGAGGLVAELTRAADGAAVGPAPAVALDTTRRQVQVTVPHAAWNPGTGTVRLAAGVGLWNATTGRYMTPLPAASATAPGGGASAAPAAFFNVAFRTDEPNPDPTNVAAISQHPAWWRDVQQAEALRNGDITAFHADVDFAKLAAGIDDDGGVPTTGPMDRILASHFEVAQGADYSVNCLVAQANCKGVYQGRLQPYAIYVPRKPRPAAGYGMTLLLHSLAANYNQYSSSNNQSQLGERGGGSIVITPEGRGPDGFYTSYAGADTFEVWADVARHYDLDADWTSISGYSMGGYGTFRFGQQFPDLFARAQPTVGTSPDIPDVPSLRNLPVLMWNASTDELVPETSYLPAAQALDDAGYRYELDIFAPAEHLTLAVNDEYGPAAAFLGTARVDRDPPHVTFVRDKALEYPQLDLVADHAYWVSGVTLRTGTRGQVDVLSHGFGVGDPTPSSTRHGAGSLTGGTLPAIAFSRQYRTWGPAPAIPRANQLDITATNVSAITIDAARAHVTCDAKLAIHSDGPLKVTWTGCDAAAGSQAHGCSAARRLTGVGIRRRGHGARVSFRRTTGDSVDVDVFQSSHGRRVVGERLVARFPARSRSFTWNGRANVPHRRVRDGYFVVRLRSRGKGDRDTRRLALRRVRGRFSTRPAYYRRDTCGLIAKHKLERPVFGGPRNRAEYVAYRLTRAARVGVAVLRGGRVVRRYVTRQRRAGVTYRVRFDAEGHARGDYRFRVTAADGAGRTTASTLTARRL